MRIAQITRQYLPSMGGIESSVEGLSRALQDAGHKVRVVTLRKIFRTNEKAPRNSVVNGISVTRIGHWGPRRYPIAPAILCHLAQADLLHVHAVDFFVDFLSLARPFHRRPIVLSTHGGFFHTRWMERFKSAYFRAITRSVLKNVDAVICVSPHDFEVFAAIVPKHKLHLVPNGVETEAYQTVQKSIEPGLLLGIGRTSVNKGIDNLIRALAVVRKARPDTRLVWVGPDDGRTTELIELAHQMGVADAVKFTGQIKTAELRRMLSRAHLFVSTASYEGYGLASVEAMSSGTVPVVTPVGIHPQLIDHGKNGFLVDGNPSSFAAGLLQVLNIDLVELARIGHESRRTVQKCTWRHSAEGYLQIYRSVLAKQPVREVLNRQAADCPEA